MIMKKLLLLALVALSGVMNASAETKRIYVQNSTGADLYVYAWSGEEKLLGNWPGTKLTNTHNSTTNVENWYWVDVDFPTGVNNISLKFNNNGGKECNEITFAGDKYFKVWGKSDWGTWGDISNCGSSNDLKFYLLNPTTGDYSQELTPATGDLQYTIDIDNTDGSNSEYIILPSFVTDNYMSEDDKTKKWNLSIRPWSDYATLSFSNITMNQDKANIGIWSSNSNSWKTNNVKAHFVLTVDLKNFHYSVSPYFERTLNSAAEGYATFSSTYDVTVPSGLTASYASAVSDGKITWANVTTIKAGKGALLQGTAGSTYRFTPATDADNGTDMMEAIPDEVLLTNPTGYYAYILSKVNNQLGFYKVNSDGSWVNPGTAYLKVPVSAAREFYLFGDDELTSINAVENVKMEGQAYNLNGQRVAQPTKGLYIVNGKKVIIK